MKDRFGQPEGDSATNFGWNNVNMFDTTVYRYNKTYILKLTSDKTAKAPSTLTSDKTAKPPTELTSDKTATAPTKPTSEKNS